MATGMKCECGFQFSGAGEFRNCAAFVTKDGESGVICPKCGNQYLGDVLVGKIDAPNS